MSTISASSTWTIQLCLPCSLSAYVRSADLDRIDEFGAVDWTFPYNVDSWAAVSDTCRSGRRQSPVALPEQGGLQPRLLLEYKYSRARAFNSGNGVSSFSPDFLAISALKAASVCRSNSFMIVVAPLVLDDSSCGPSSSESALATA